MWLYGRSLAGVVLMHSVGFQDTYWQDMMEQPWILLPDIKRWPTTSITALIGYLTDVLLEREKEVKP